MSVFMCFLFLSVLIVLVSTPVFFHHSFYELLQICKLVIFHPTQDNRDLGQMTLRDSSLDVQETDTAQGLQVARSTAWA